MVTAAWEFLGKIPATFWGVVAGSFFTLLGLWFTNRAQAERLERQLTHDRALKTLEREMTLKRDVYLPAVEAIAAGVMVVSRLGDLAPSFAEVMSDLSSRGGAIERATLVGSDETLSALVAVQSTLGSKIAALTPERLRLTDRSEDMKRMLESHRTILTTNNGLLALRQKEDVTANPVR